MNDSRPNGSSDDQVDPILDMMFAGCEEVVGIEHVQSILAGGESHSGNSHLVAYIGLEPSGSAHLGWVILAETMRNLLDGKANLVILLADWHAWVNDKFGRDMEKISLAADYMCEVFRSMLVGYSEGDGDGQFRFLRASELMDSGKYWERVLRCSKNMSLSRVRRTFSIMGRDADSSDHDLSAFFYPALQAADIFELEIDIAFGGMDQRKAHMYMREVADKHGWTKATCIHTPMLSGLRGSSGRMETFDHKMSKSDPNNAILLHDKPDEISKKMKKAFLEVGNPESPVFEIARHVVIPNLGEILVSPKPEFGEQSRWENVDDFVEGVGSGQIHPFDAKMAVANGVNKVLEPISEYFLDRGELLSSMAEITR